MSELDKQSVEDPHGYVPGFTTPAEEAEKKQKIGEHPVSQAEKLLSKPIIIPRSPWALIIDVASIVLLADIVAALGAALLLAALAGAGGLAAVFVLLLLVIKTVVVVAVIVRMALEWVPTGYEITERQLIKKAGVRKKEDRVFELANIRHVTVKQGFIARQLGYGTVELLIATAGLNETIKLEDVTDPDHFREIFSDYLG